jgi:hypothetical protein
MKVRIVAEIRRISEANGGRPPGRQKFEADTGIRTGEWLGVYWARWGDALTEAGYAPNEKQGKFDKNHVLRKLADSCRHFGHVPTSAEQKIYQRIDTAFPSHSTVSNHFPSKDELVEALRIWLVDNSEYDDVRVMLPSFVAPTPSTIRQPIADEGMVYLIKSGQYYKIGRSDELERRIKQIRVALPDTADLIHTIRTDDPVGIESYWHRRFADRRGTASGSN